MEIYFSMESQSRFVVLMKCENFHFDHNVFCIPQETDWQKVRYEENIVNDSQWLN